MNNSCYESYLCSNFFLSIVFLGNYLLLFFPIFLFSIITYFLKDEIFKSWSKFTYVWLPLSIILTSITPDSRGGFFVSLWDPEMTAIFMTGLYALISLIIIIVGVIKNYFSKKIVE